MDDPVIQKANVIYQDTCSCSEYYVEKTKRNSEVRLRERYCTKKTSEVADHLLLNHGNIKYSKLENIDKCF